jgi:hypothetical protein
MTLSIINTIKEYENFNFKVDQVFKIGVLEYTVVDINGQLWIKNQDGYGSELKLKGTTDSFKWAIECNQSLVQIK